MTGEKQYMYIHHIVTRYVLFCNLNRKQIDGSLDSYAQYIADDLISMEKLEYLRRNFDVIFLVELPQYIKPNQLEVILESIKRNVTLAKDYEFTF